MKKPIPIGYEDFKQVIDEDAYYVDKTGMIKELLDSAVSVSLFTRPRRFGKTLNLSMIQRFFEDERDRDGEPINNKSLFTGLQIIKQGQRYLRHQQQYPVIHLSLKSARQPDFHLAYAMLKQQIIEEYSRHQYILNDLVLTNAEKKRYTAILNGANEPSLYLDALAFLSKCLAIYHQQKALVLIDEYDVPLENAWFEGFYEEMSTFVRSLFESVLKTNPHLKFAVITGCLRISRESIFTGLNNLRIYSVMETRYAECFGFTVSEVKKMLSYYELEDKYDEVKSWYDGYRFGAWEIYNPWSIMNYVDRARTERNAFPRPYWSNTSSNSIIRELVEQADEETRVELEQLIAGETIEKPIHEEITYEEIHRSQENLWNFLYFTGYLKKIGERQQGEEIYMELTIPNAEIRSIYRSTILSWFDEKICSVDFEPLLQAIETGDCRNMEKLISEQLLDTISFYDYAENYYHGFLAGLLKALKKYRVFSNRESGTGRPDILMKTPFIRNGTAVIFEIKAADTYQTLKTSCERALQQIREQNYEAAVRMEGYEAVRKYGIAFYKKECMVLEG